MQNNFYFWLFLPCSSCKRWSNQYCEVRFYLTSPMSQTPITITENESGQRLDRFLRKRCRDQHDILLSDIYAWIRKWACRINWKKAKENYRLVTGDTLSRHEWKSEQSVQDLRAPKKQKIKSYDLQKIKQMIVFEDDNRIVRNKPAGVVTHPGKDHATDMSLHDIMQSYLMQTAQKTTSSTFNPSFCFRLDKDTSWIIISAKTYDALQWLNEQIRERKVNKSYLCIVAGKTPQSLRMEWTLQKGYDRDFGVAKMEITKGEWKESLTTAKTITQINHKTVGRLSLLDVTLHTWRMHQIRIHLSDAGFPVVGDLMYGNPVVNRLAKKEKVLRQLLHSTTYSFWDPFTTRQQSFTAPYPEDFSYLIAYA